MEVTSWVGLEVTSWVGLDSIEGKWLGQVVWLPTPSGVHFTQHLLVVVLGIRSWVWIGFTHALHIAVLGQVVNFGSVISLSSCTFGCSSCLKDWGGRLADCERVFDLLHKTNCRVSKRHDVQGGGGGGMANLGGLHCFELVLSVRMLLCWLCAKFVWLSELLVLPKTLPILWECCVEFVVLWIFGFKLVGFIGNDIRS